MHALSELVRAAAARAPASVVADSRSSLTLADALREAEDVARAIARTSPRERPLVAVVLPGSVATVTHLLAAVLGDHTVCFLDPGAGPRTEAVLDALDPDVVVDASGVHPRPADPARPDPVTAGYVAMSSGTTGTGAKGVLTSWACLADFLPHGAEALDLDSAARWAEPTHPSYDLALTNWLLALAAGASLHVSGSLADRVRPLAFLARREATHVRLAPGYVDLAATEAGRGAPCEVRVWGSGGDRLSPAQARTVLGLGRATLVNTYGTSETGGFASAAAYASPDEVRARDGSVSVGRGRVGPWRVGLVRDEKDAGEDTVGDDAVGEDEVLAIHSPHVGDGYLFGGHGQDYPRWEPGRVVTGDRGVVADGEVYCLGRVGRLVKRSAGFVNLDDVDTAIRDVRGIVSYTVATRGGSLVTLVEGDGHPLTAVREDLATRVAPGVLPDRLVPVRSLPRLGNGKTDQAGAVRLAERALGQGQVD
jgi:acyl-CoA synthetase (AMP-forming)/AMP-acid ligase II